MILILRYSVLYIAGILIQDIFPLFPHPDSLFHLLQLTMAPLILYYRGLPVQVTNNTNIVIPELNNSGSGKRITVSYEIDIEYFFASISSDGTPFTSEAVVITAEAFNIPAIPFESSFEP